VYDVSINYHKRYDGSAIRRAFLDLFPNKRRYAYYLTEVRAIVDHRR
jgi:hypothetical protein